MIIWLASFPRSGNTLLTQIVHKAFRVRTWSVYGDLYDIDTLPQVAKSVGHQNEPLTPERLKTMRKSRQPFFIKTHELPGDFLLTQDLAVHVIRCPKDAYFSYAKYNAEFAPARELSLAQLIASDGKDNWTLHTLSWLKAGAAQQILLLRFEELRDMQALAARKIGEYIGQKPSLTQTLLPKYIKEIESKGFINDGKSGKGAKNFTAFERDIFHASHGKSYKSLELLETDLDTVLISFEQMLAKR